MEKKIKKRIFLHNDNSGKERIEKICSKLKKTEYLIFEQENVLKDKLKGVTLTPFNYFRKKKKVFEEVKIIFIDNYELLRKDVFDFLKAFEFPNLEEIQIYCKKAYCFFLEEEILEGVKKLKEKKVSKDCVFKEINKKFCLSLESFNIYFFNFFSEPDISIFVIRGGKGCLS